jgi:DNA-binding NarL/FixJ family response regulator
MEKQLTLETANPLKILLVEDSTETRGNIVKFLKQSFPDAEIKAVNNLSEAGGIEELIKNNQYSVVFLDGSLNYWLPHPKFRCWGGNLLPENKELSPSTITVAISSDNRYNKKMLEEGADLALEKSTFYSRGKKLALDFTVVDA